MAKVVKAKVQNLVVSDEGDLATFDADEVGQFTLEITERSAHLTLVLSSDSVARITKTGAVLVNTGRAHSYLERVGENTFRAEFRKFGGGCLNELTNNIAQDRLTHIYCDHK